MLLSCGRPTHAARSYGSNIWGTIFQISSIPVPITGPLLRHIKLIGKPDNNSIVKSTERTRPATFQ